MVNNQVLWSGSLISIGPKGEEATIAAPRRGGGDEFCDGMGQEVYVLDPMGHCDVPDAMRAHFNPLAGLESNDEELVSKVRGIADAMCKLPEGGEARQWAEKGKSYVADVMLHVLTSDLYGDDRDDARDLLTVRDLVLAGNVRGAQLREEALKRRAAEEGGNPGNVYQDSYRVLLEDMILNKGCDGAISRSARERLNLLETHGEGFASIRTSAADHVRFLEGRGIQRTVAKPRADRGGYARTFSIDELKGERPISVFVTLPEFNYDPLDRWLRTMIQVCVEGLQKRQGLPASGERVLFCIDEFSNLGKLDVVERAANSLAGSGVKLMIATQRLGDLIHLYGKAWEKFVSSAGVQIWFNLEELETRHYIEKKLGDTEIVKVSRSVARTKSRTESSTTSEAYTHTNSMSEAHMSGSTAARSESRGSQSSRHEGKTDSTNWSIHRANSKSAVRGYGPHVFMEPWTHTNQYGESWSSGSGRGGGIGNTSGTSTSESHGTTESSGTQQSTTRQSGESTARQSGRAATEAATEGEQASISEQFHVRPLLSAQEARRQFLSPRDADHPMYPGFALVLVAEEEHPFFVRKVNHDQDAFFVRKFHPNPAHPFIPIDEQPIFGWQITPDHFLSIQVPDELADETFDLNVLVEVGVWVETGEPLFSTSGLLSGEVLHRAPSRAKITSISQENGRADNLSEIMELRFDKLITPDAADHLSRAIWKVQLADLAERTLRRKLQREADELAKLRQGYADQLESVAARMEATQQDFDRVEALLSQESERIEEVKEKISTLEQRREWRNGLYWVFARRLGYVLVAILWILILKDLLQGKAGPLDNEPDFASWPQFLRVPAGFILMGVGAMLWGMILTLPLLFLVAWGNRVGDRDQQELQGIAEKHSKTKDRHRVDLERLGNLLQMHRASAKELSDKLSESKPGAAGVAS